VVEVSSLAITTTSYLLIGKVGVSTSLTLTLTSWIFDFSITVTVISVFSRPATSTTTVEGEAGSELSDLISMTVG
jgi:hypothetical protein